MRNMFKVSCISLAFMFFIIGAGHAGSGHDGTRGRYKEGEILVKFKSGISEPAKADLHKKLGSRKIKDFPALRIEHIELRAGLNVEQAIEEYRRDSAVEYAEPNFLVHASGTVPNDPLFAELWGLHNTGQQGGSPGSDISAPDAWSLTSGSDGIVIAVIDSGIDYTHEDITANMWVNAGEYGKRKGVDDDGNGYVDDLYGIDVYNKDGNPLDDNGHGTHVAGTIGASGNNGLGVAGVNWKVKILACKFISAGGTGYTDGAIQCLEYVRAMKARGVNLVATNNSWGGSAYSQALYDAINAQRDILFIAAAGNSGADIDAAPSYPASYALPNLIAVAATDRNDGKASFSSYGRRSVHVGAPGADIVSLRARSTDMYGDAAHFIPAGDSRAKYYIASGTSMAAPHVTGLAALLKARIPSADWIYLKNRILSGSDPVSSLEGSVVTGGRINAYRALTCADSSLFSVLQHPRKLVAGNPEILSALSIQCEAPAGPVFVTLGGGEVIQMYDDGAAPDLAAGDGVFSAYWTPAGESEYLSFSAPTGTETLSIPALSITTSVLLEANTRAIYHEFVKAIGGLSPYIWSVATGALPIGLVLNAVSGEISGTATNTGYYNFSVRVTDAALNSVVKDLSIRVVDDPVLALWLRVFDNYTGADAVTLDGSGNVLTAGVSLKDGSIDRIVRKHDSLGAELWSRIITAADKGTGISCDASGNALVTGSKYLDYLTQKLDPQGNVLWSMTYGNSSRLEYASDIAADAAGNAYVTGYATGGVNGNDYLTVKYDPLGNAVWTGTYDSGYSDAAFGVAVDPAGRFFVAGHHSTGLAYDCVIVQYDPEGNMLRTGAYPNAQCFDIKTDAGGNIYVAGGSGNDFLVLKYGPDLNLLWTRAHDSGKLDVGRGIDVDANGNIYVTGESHEASSSAYDTLTAAFDSAGNLLWTKVFEGGSGKGIAVDTAGDVYVAGYTQNASFTIKYRKQ